MLKFLAFAAHPDDAEMSVSGTLLRLKQANHWTGIIDLTKGELGSRGTAATRATESANASKLLSLNHRENLDLGDGNIENIEINRKKIIATIRKHQPDFVFINAPSDRHRDHGKAAELLIDACFLSGLAKYDVGTEDKAHRPKNVFHYIQDYYHQPNFVVDITAVFEERMKVVMAYETQFFQGKDAGGPVTPISSPDFLEYFNGRASQMGRLIQKRFGEGFIAVQPLNLEEMNWF